MKTAVDKVKKGKGRVVNARFSALCAHYLFDPDFCNVASGWEKEVVEKNVQDSRRRVWQEAVRETFSSFGELNIWLSQRCRALWGELTHPEYREVRVSEALEHELPHLLPGTQSAHQVSFESARTILDNYRIHDSRVVQGWLARHPRVKRLFQPTYHPWVNRIERLWKQLHDTVTRNHRYKNLDTLMNAVRRFCKFANLSRAVSPRWPLLHDWTVFTISYLESPIGDP